MVWPVRGVPSDPGVVLEFLQDVRLCQAQLVDEGVNPGPIVMHCSSGVGRTGTLMVIDILINLISHQGKLIYTCCLLCVLACCCVNTLLSLV